MTFNLTEARRLHDRDPGDPGHCLSGCLDWDSFDPAPDDHDSTPYRQNWPCKTATALGATGHSEWTDAGTDNLRRVHIPAAGWYHIATGTALQPDTTTETTFDTDPPTIFVTCTADACVLDTGHRGDHVYRNGDKICGYRLSDVSCRREVGHGGVHVSREGLRYGTCGYVRAEGRTAYPCTLNAGHDTVPHRDWEGTTW